MSQDNEPNLFQPLDQMLSSFGLVTGASEFHGLLVGAICAGASEQDWLALAQTSLDDTEQLPEPVVVAGRELYGVYSKLLAERDFQFQLLLPPAEVELMLTARCLAEWVTGFLAALGEQGVGEERLSEDGQELLSDLVAITQIVIDEDDDGDERDMFDVVEYVRVAVFNLYEDLHRSPDSGPTVH